MDWLNRNGVAVTAIVTAVYAVFTVLLWLATRRQAALTQRAVEATNRPYLSIRIVGEVDIAPTTNDVVGVQALIENVGTIPAEVTRWEVSGRVVNGFGFTKLMPTHVARCRQGA